jgi:acyl carrier protein
MNNVMEKIREFVLGEFLPGENPATLTPTTPLISGGIIDSIDAVKLIVFLENEFGIEVEAFDADLDNLDTLEALDRFVSAKRQAGENG